MFYNRVALKRAALAQLKGNWKSAALVGLSIVAVYLLYLVAFGMLMLAINRMGDDTRAPVGLIFGFMGITMVVVLLMIVAFVAAIRFGFILVRTGKATYADFLASFWLKSIGAYLYSMLWLYLWALVMYAFVIPMGIGALLIAHTSSELSSSSAIASCVLMAVSLVGFFCYYVFFIAKAISYSCIYYALVDEHPNLTVTNALTRSVHVTQGFKTNLFFTNLSFAGWSLLGIATLGIAFVWIIPYFVQVHINAWLFMKQEKGLAAPRPVESVEEKTIPSVPTSVDDTYGN